MISGLLTFLLLAALAVGIGLVGYSLIASDLPAPGDLRNRASNFQTTRIYDREGNLLNATFDPNTGLRTALPLDQMALTLQQATIATEDANFYRHPGVDPTALARALYYAFTERDIVSGGSTIPQQLVKMVFLSPERTVTRKVKEAILASEISRRYSKEQILEIYLNELFYGSYSYGVAAAAETYFGKKVGELTLAESALLAGLPQLPAYYDPYSHPDRAKERQGVVLGLMVEQGYITEAEADAAFQEPLAYKPLEFNLTAPHYTLFVRQQLEQLLGPDALYKAGLEVHTTLDPRLQAEAERIVAENVAALAANNGSNGALVAIRPDTGELLALVGSADFNNVEIDGQVNMALAPRQPGSTMKPLVYLASFEQPEVPLADRWTPGTLVADIREAFPDGVNPPYVPENYDGREHGLLTVRNALGNSYNIPAVRALQQVGLPDFLELAGRLGITTLTRPDYGLSLSLGAGEVPLVEMTQAFSVLAADGRKRPLVTISRIADASGNIICDVAANRPCTQDPAAADGAQVLSPVDAFLISDILSDNEARSVAFGPNSVLRLDRPAAVKTGTTNDIRDILTIGYTPQLVTGVWVGNADNTPMSNVSGVSGAAPIWSQFMTSALAGQPAVPFTPPPGVRQFEVCADTGTLPSPACPEKRLQWFAEDRPPLPAENDLWQRFRIDRTTGELASEFTPAENVEEKSWKVYPEPWRQWAIDNGIEQPPFVPPAAERPGTVTTPLATLPPAMDVRLGIFAPAEGETVSGLVTVYGTVMLPNLLSYELQYGETHNPGAFSAPVAGPYGGAVESGPLAQWETTGLPEGPYTLRLLARDARGAEYEARSRIFVVAPPPTLAPPTPTAEPSPTWTLDPIVLTQTPAYFPPPETATPLPPELPQPPVQPTETPAFIFPVEPGPTDEPWPTPVTPDAPLLLPPPVPETPPTLPPGAPTPQG
jgi:penicillin-binding protein 1C